MKVIKGDIWGKKADAICITTNSVVKQNGRAVMGKGVALDAKLKFPSIDYSLGVKLKKGNNVYLLTEECKKVISLIGMTIFSIASNLPYHIVSFPTKNHWRDKSSLSLIVESSKQLIELTDAMKWKKVIIPKPGCNNGQLDWKVVRSKIKPILDNRFYIISKKI